MYLPVFNNKSITSDELLVEQARLHAQADKLLADTNLINIFGKYGTASPIEGSYSYGLMVYPDLDIQIITNHQLTKQEFADIVRKITTIESVRGLSVADRVNFSSTRVGRPSGYWLGLDIPFENDRWGVDIWVQTKKQATGDSDRYKEKLTHLTSEQKVAILAIKYHLIREGMYGKPYLSVDVYDAVLGGVSSFDEFMSRC